jgi:hypothetical protein
MAIKESYDRLRKKHNLPDFDKINNEFEISTLEKDDFLIRAVRRRMAEKLSHFAKFLEDLLSPDASFASMTECRDITEDDKQQIFDLFQKLMYFGTLSSQLDLLCDDDKEVDFIIKFFAEWQAIKKDLNLLLEKIKSSWTEKDSKDFKATYLG